ncbi:MAG: PQQ-binding-like beta-propeller repeat protein [Phycisphaerae bacterium]
MPYRHAVIGFRQGLVAMFLACMSLGYRDAGQGVSTARAKPPTESAPQPQDPAHHPPKPLAPDAVTSDWPTFLGPHHDGSTPETPLLTRFPPGGPNIVWAAEIGTGYASPAIVGDRLIVFHRIGDEEIVDCLNGETGRRLWRHAYPTHYHDRYQFSGGPRSSPTIHDGLVFTYGAEGMLHCLDLDTGEVRWRTNIIEKYKVAQNFFGVGSTPLVWEDVLVVLVGASGGPCVVGLDKQSGAVRWQAGSGWSAGYASPIPATIHGQDRVLMFTGGDSEPPDGGLLSIDPATGGIDRRVPFRSKNYTSVNAANPVVVGHQVFLTSSYKTGGALVNLRSDIGYDIAWKNNHLRSQFATPIHRDGYLYGFDEINRHNCGLVCVELSTGRQLWRVVPQWKERRMRNNAQQEQTVTAGRASIISADGHFLLLGEEGQLAWVDLSPQGYKELSKTTLFDAPQTWTPPAIGHGLLYIRQNKIDRSTKAPPRILCYDLRG